MTITPAQFRTDFTEFADTVKYPDSAVQEWLDLGYLMLDPNRWGSFQDKGVELLTAHNLVLEAEAIAQAAKGLLPGTSVGILTSKSLGPASGGYDVGSMTRQGDGDYNKTTYGIRFSRLNRIAGMAPVYVGGFDPLPGTVL